MGRAKVERFLLHTFYEVRSSHYVQYTQPIKVIISFFKVIFSRKSFQSSEDFRIFYSLEDFNVREIPLAQ